MLDVINRSAVIVMPAEPFLKWLHRADSTSAELTLADLRREPTIYLLPPYDTEEQALVIWRRCAGKSSKSNSTDGTVYRPPGPSTGISTCSSAGLSTVSIRC